MGREEKAKRVQERFPDIAFTGWGFNKWLRKQGAAYLTMKYKIGDNYTREHRLNLQQEFCLKLLQHWRYGHELIFVDECTVHPWIKGGLKAWQFKNDPVFL